MLTANEKDQIINNRGESDKVGKSSKAYTVILTDGKCTVLSLNGKDMEGISLSCKQRFGDKFVRIE